MIMARVTSYIRNNPISWLLVALPLAILAKLGGWGSIWVFTFSALGVIPMAGLIGTATEALAKYTGPKIGGLLNATLGNAAELIITLVAVKAGLMELVKASITGSIIGNLLLVMGFSMVFGGAKHGVQRFDRQQVSNHTVMMTLAVLALVIPSLFSHSIGPETGVKVEVLSLGVALFMIVLYGFGLFYSLKVMRSPISYEAVEVEQDGLTKTQALVVLAFATIGVVGLSELLVGAVEDVVAAFHLSEFFLGIILIPIVGNVAEHLVAVQVALKNKMELSVEIATSSSLQVALFVAPLLVFISLAMGHPLTLIFNPFELMALGASVIIAGMVAADGESNWLEGAASITVYLILGLAFFLLPA
jgi:Ca2+:H+ antiporter